MTQGSNGYTSGLIKIIVRMQKRFTHDKVSIHNAFLHDQSCAMTNHMTHEAG